MTFPILGHTFPIFLVESGKQAHESGGDFWKKLWQTIFKTCWHVVANLIHISAIGSISILTHQCMYCKLIFSYGPSSCQAYKPFFRRCTKMTARPLWFESVVKDLRAKRSKELSGAILPPDISINLFWISMDKLDWSYSFAKYRYVSQHGSYLRSFMNPSKSSEDILAVTWRSWLGSSTHRAWNLIFDALYNFQRQLSIKWPKAVGEWTEDTPRFNLVLQSLTTLLTLWSRFEKLECETYLVLGAPPPPRRENHGDSCKPCLPANTKNS